jgi:chromosome segregation ATPase
MTDNQFNQLFDLVTKCVNGIQELREGQGELKSDISELKVEVSELKEGQTRIEKQIRLNNAAVNEMAGEQLRINSRVTELEKASV